MASGRAAGWANSSEADEGTYHGAARRDGRLGVVAGLLVALIAMLACAVRVSTIGEEPPPRRPDASDGRTAEDGTQTFEEFERDAVGAVRVAERYWAQRFEESGREFVPVRRVVTYRAAGQVACGSQGVPRNNAIYCSAGDFIAYDVRWAFAAFRQIGDAFVYYLLGHEYAHAVQTRLGIRYDFTIQQELQADCMAGAYLGDSVRAGTVTLDDGDLDELRAGLLAVADDPDQPWFAEGAHGSVEQRTDAFFAGYRRSLDACGLN